VGSWLWASVSLPRVGWEIQISSRSGFPGAAHQASHELTHGVQQGGMSSAWLRRRTGIGAGAAKSPTALSILGGTSTDPELGRDVRFAELF